jgi:hypothetical protein
MLANFAYTRRKQARDEAVKMQQIQWRTTTKRKPAILGNYAPIGGALWWSFHGRFKSPSR